MTRYLYRVVDRDGEDRWYSGDPCSNPAAIQVFTTIEQARQVVADAERDDREYPDDPWGPFRILRVPVTAWEEVK